MQRAQHSLSLVSFVSGGETGAERAVLDFALANDVPHQGFCPRGRFAEDGRISSRYRLTESARSEPSESIWLNVSSAQGVVIFDPTTAGRHGRTVVTLAACKRARRPFVVVDSNLKLEQDIRTLTGFLVAYTPANLYLTGRSENSLKGIYQHVTQVLRSLPFTFVARASEPARSQKVDGPAPTAYPHTNRPWL